MRQASGAIWLTPIDALWIAAYRVINSQDRVDYTNNFSVADEASIPYLILKAIINATSVKLRSQKPNIGSLAFTWVWGVTCELIHSIIHSVGMAEIMG